MDHGPVTSAGTTGGGAVEEEVEPEEAEPEEAEPDSVMSLNRELVLFYITYKLSQRNIPLDHIGLLDPAHRSDSAPSPDSTPGPQTAGLEPRFNGTVNGSSSLSQSTSAPPTAPPTASPTADLPEATPSDSTDAALVHSLLPPSPSAAAPPSGALAPPTADAQVTAAVKEALRDSANEFELRFSRAFSDLHRQLHITPATAYRSFESVMDEVFRDGVNWGRVVGLFAFGGALCVECVDKEMSHLVSRIVEWMTVYLDNHIQDWITAQGGWARFAEIYGDDAAAESRRSQESLKKWLWAGATLVTGVVVGSLLAQRRL